MDQVVQNVTAVAVQRGNHFLQKRILPLIVSLLWRAVLFTAISSVLRYNQQGDNPSSPKDEKKIPEYFSSVRIYAGSNPLYGAEWNMKGNAPDISLWTESGQKIGQSLGYARTIAQGAFIDMPVKHHERIQSARPHYLNLIAGGTDALCITGIEVTYPDGEGVTITGDILRRCAMLGTKVNGQAVNIVTESMTQMGFEGQPPACFYLDRDKSFPHLWMSAVSFRLPDFHPTDARAEEWTKHPERLCGPSPRLFYHEGKMSTRSPIPIWYPPFEVHYNGTDKDPNRVADWHKLHKKEKNYSLLGRDLTGLDDGSNHQFFSDGEIKRSEDAVSEICKGFFCISKLLDGMFGTSQAAQESDLLTIDASLPDQPRQLVTSHRVNFSAVEQCHYGHNIGKDYVSTSERVYCDMRLRNMWRFCRHKSESYCFDAKSNTLRRYGQVVAADATNSTVVGQGNVEDNHGADAPTMETAKDEQTRSSVAKRDDRVFSGDRTMAAPETIWARTHHDSPLFGIQYANVTVLD